MYDNYMEALLASARRARSQDRPSDFCIFFTYYNGVKQTHNPRIVPPLYSNRPTPTTGVPRSPPSYTIVVVYARYRVSRRPSIAPPSVLRSGNFFHMLPLSLLSPFPLTILYHVHYALTAEALLPI